jgi:small-conductance mechanosensitive channel
MGWDQIAATLSEDPRMRQAAILVVAVGVAVLVRLFFSKVVRLLTAKTLTDVDDRIAHELRNPAFFSVILVGLMLAHLEFEAPAVIDKVVIGVILTVIGGMWAVALMRVGRVALEIVSSRVDKITWIEPRTLPLFDMILKVAVAGGFLYVLCIAWDIPLTSWLASAGVIGIAVGFAAKDTLSNLFSGIFIVADSPYKVGDFVVLDNTTRGQVLEIGMRSTRLLTRDDIEVTVPNSVIANSQIVNQTGGPSDKMRVRVKVEAAYGSDAGQVEKVLLGCIEGVGQICGEPAPRVRFRSFGASGLEFELLAWIEEPIYRGRVLHALNTNVYNAFNAAGIEIPYAKQDVYVKELPRRRELK